MYVDVDVYVNVNIMCIFISICVSSPANSTLSDFIGVLAVSHGFPENGHPTKRQPCTTHSS